MKQESIVAHLFRHALASPEAVSLVMNDTSISYADLAGRILAVGRSYESQGLKPGDRVVLLASNTPEFVVSYFALHLSRLVSVPMDAGASATRMEYIRQRVDAGMVLTAADQKALVSDAGCDDDVESERIARAESGPGASELADIMFTSGTTGTPKGVMLNHANLVSGARHINSVIGTGPEDVELIALPLSHSFGLGSLRCVLSQGARAVLVSGFTFPGQIIELIGRHRVTGFRCVPAGLATLFRVAGDSLGLFADTLRYMELGSAPLPAPDRERLLGLLPETRICMHYGLTEATRSVYTNFREGHRPDSVGFPAPGVKVRVVDENFEDVQPNEGGEILIHGAHVMPGYWEDPERTREALVDDWLRTGDHGYLDEQGRLYLSGRRRDIINVGGKKVGPIEVENALRGHPAVRDCAVAGIPDPAGISGEVVAALVLPADVDNPPTERILKAYLRDLLEPFKIPVKWVFEGTIPYTENGKVQRHLLAETLTGD